MRKWVLAMSLLAAASGVSYTKCVQAMSLDEPMSLLAQGDEFEVIHRPHMAPVHRGTLIFFAPLLDPVGAKTGFTQLRSALSRKGYDSYLVINHTSFSNSESEEDTASSASTPETAATPAGENSASAESTAPSDEAIGQKNEQSYVPPFQPPVLIVELDKYKSQLLAQLESVVEKASETQKPISIFAVGQSAGLLSEYFTEYPDLPLQAIVAFNTYLPDPERNRHISANFSIIAPAVFDIRDVHASSWSKALVEQSTLWAQKNQKFDYRQINLIDELDNPQQTAQISQEIDGFLRRLF
ncbi:DUF3530 family protein [Pseudoalteromonas pernae]|uniref:DUF3530 family protein n=1 Tax=Pseudoalteromonas pernae TaxID=3118054 RepID=UPI003242D8E8